MIRFLKVSVLFLVIGAVIGGLYFARGKFAKFFANSKEESDTKIGQIVKGDITSRITASGWIRPLRRTEIKPPYDGYVKKLYVKIGDVVKPGDPLISVAESLENSAEAVFPLRAPFPGTVVHVLCSEGQYVESKATDNVLIRVDDLSTLFVEADIPELDLPKIKMGQKTVIRPSALLDMSYDGIVTEISLAAKQQDRWSRETIQFPVKVKVVKPDGNLHSGMSVLIDIISSQKKEIFTLKHEFIERENGKYFVTTAKGEKKEIKIGLQDDAAAEVISGLAEGEKVKQVDFLQKAANG